VFIFGAIVAGDASGIRVCFLGENDQVYKGRKVEMEYRLADRVGRIKPSMTLAIDAKAKELQKNGVDVVGFGAGEPDFDTPAHIKKAAVDALEAGFTKYTPVAGIPELRRAITHKFERENGVSYAPEQIVVSCGGKHTCFNVIQVLCQEGDEVIVPTPYWVSYPEMVRLAGADPVFVPTDESTGFKMTPAQLRAAITPRTRLVILNSPSNPTGAVYTPLEVQALAAICLEKGVFILSDEIYEHLVYGDTMHRSPASCGPAYQAITIIAHGFAKAWSMTGWRLGFCAAPLPIAKAIVTLQSHCTSNAVSFAQKGGVAALDGPQDHLIAWRKAFSERRLYALERLNAMPGISCCEPEGAFYLFPNVSGTGLGSVAFCDMLLEEQRVAAVPGVAFGADENIRISYATDMATIEKGLARMDAFCRGL
jgi:aspartate aminotransferase